MSDKKKAADDTLDEGRSDHFMDVDRMINEGLGGGNVTMHNGLIEESSTDTMKHSDSVMNRLHEETSNEESHEETLSEAFLNGKALYEEVLNEEVFNEEEE